MTVIVTNNNITSANANITALTASTINNLKHPNAGPLSNRNLIINGAMQVAQRGTQATGVTDTSFRTVDRFKEEINSLGTWTIDQATDAPDDFTFSFKATCTTANASPAAGAYSFLGYKVEAQDLQQLNYGSSTARAMTLSFWVKSNKTGNATVTVLQRDNSIKLLSPQYSISSANTWEYKTISIPGDTSGVINNDNGSGLEFEFYYNAGSTYSTGSHQTTWSTYSNANRCPSVLGVGGVTSDYFAITGVQLELGSVATPFEHRSYGDELARCQRYFRKFCNGASYAPAPSQGYCYSTTGCYHLVNLSPEMRAAPSLEDYSNLRTDDLSGGTSVTNLSVATSISSKQCVALNATASSLTAFRSYSLMADNTASAYLHLSAEL